LMREEEFEERRKDLQYERLLRKQRIEAWNDYIGFFVQKVAGGGLIVGGLWDMLDPAVFPHLTHPEYMLTGGVAWLTGKPLLNLVLKALVPREPDDAI
jgi:hypothetical protein